MILADPTGYGRRPIHHTQSRNPARQILQDPERAIAGLVVHRNNF